MKMKKMNISPIKTIPVKPINILSKRNDLDRDGVPDRKDCRPLNPWKQHVRPSKTMKKRLENIPLYITDDDTSERAKIHHIEHAKKYAPKAQKEIYQMIKKYPGIVSDIEREQPRQVVYSSYPRSEDTLVYGATGKVKRKRAVIEVVSPPRSYNPKRLSKNITDFYEKEYELSPEERAQLQQGIKTGLSEYPLTDEPINIQEAKRREIRAKTFFHELHHQHQIREGGRKARKRMKQEYKEYGVAAPFEEEAEEYAEKKLRERGEEKEPTGKEISKVLKLDDELEEE